MSLSQPLWQQVSDVKSQLELESIEQAFANPMSELPRLRRIDCGPFNSQAPSQIRQLVIDELTTLGGWWLPEQVAVQWQLSRRQAFRILNHINNSKGYEAMRVERGKTWYFTGDGGSAAVAVTADGGAQCR